MKYPFNAEHRLVASLIPDELTIDDTTFITEYGYYAIENVPYQKTTHDILDSDGNLQS